MRKPSKNSDRLRSDKYKVSKQTPDLVTLQQKWLLLRFLCFSELVWQILETTEVIKTRDNAAGTKIFINIVSSPHIEANCWKCHIVSDDVANTLEGTCGAGKVGHLLQTAV